MYIKMYIYIYNIRIHIYTIFISFDRAYKFRRRIYWSKSDGDFAGRSEICSVSVAHESSDMSYFAERPDAASQDRTLCVQPGNGARGSLQGALQDQTRWLTRWQLIYNRS